MSKLLKETRSRVREDTLKLCKALEAVEALAYRYEQQANGHLKYIEEHYHKDEPSQGKSWHYSNAADLQQQADNIRSAIKVALS